MGAGPSAPAQRYDSPAAVAAILAQHRPTLLAFLSPSCGLCKSLHPELVQVSAQDVAAAASGGWPLAPPPALALLKRHVRCSQVEQGGALAVAQINAMQDRQWAPEMLAYSVETVPCFVLLDGRGG